MEDLTILEKLIGILVGTFTVLKWGAITTGIYQTIQDITGLSPLGEDRPIQMFTHETDSSEREGPIEPLIAGISSGVALITGMSIYFLGSVSAISYVFVDSLFTGSASIEMRTLFIIAGFGILATFFVQLQLIRFFESIGKCQEWDIGTRSTPEDCLFN